MGSDEQGDIRKAIEPEQPPRPRRGAMRRRIVEHDAIVHPHADLGEPRREHLRRGRLPRHRIVRIGQPLEVEEACAGDAPLGELGARIALGLHRMIGRVDDAHVGLAQMARQPVGGHQQFHPRALARERERVKAGNMVNDPSP